MLRSGTRDESDPESKGTDKPSVSADVTVDQVEQELATVLASETFARSERLCRFLRLAVETTLQGRGEDLKEYLLGVEVFDKGDSFDPRIDTIVRVEARRLRRKLDDYYRTEGQNDPVEIVFSKGRYDPSFRIRRRSTTEPQSETSPLLATSWRSRDLLILAVLVGLIVAASSIALFYRQRMATLEYEPPVVAVLPFANLSPDPENGYFADGLVEDLTDALSKVEGLSVVARTSAYLFKDNIKDLATIGRKLGVNCVMEGSIRRSGKRFRIAAQLIRIKDQQHIWSEVYERDLQDAFVVQKEIATAIARALKLRIAAIPGGTKVSQTDEALQAYDLYLKGRYIRRQMTAEGIEKSASLFEQAIQRDPSFVPAHAALADCYAMMGFHGIIPPEESIPKAKAAVSQALNLDASNANAHGVLGWMLFFYDWDWPASESQFRRAIELDPGWSSVRQWFAFALVSRKRFNDAIEQSRKALDLDPMSYVAGDDLAGIHYYAGHYDEAMRLARQALELNPELTSAHGLLGMCLAAKARYREAIEEFGKTPVSTRRYGAIAGRIGHANALAGNRAEALALLDQLARDCRMQPMKRFVERAFICAGLGDPEQMFDLLEGAHRQRDPALVFLNVEPIFHPFRADAKFKALAEKLGI